MAKLVLYYADWCPHCQSFMPVWERIRRIAPKYKIDAISYNDSTDHLIMKRDNIESFPTLIYISGGKKKEITERDEESIIDIIKGGKMKMQAGGAKKKHSKKVSKKASKKVSKKKSGGKRMSKKTCKRTGKKTSKKRSRRMSKKKSKK